jgi:hypothetical protein
MEPVAFVIVPQGVLAFFVSKAEAFVWRKCLRNFLEV